MPDARSIAIGGHVSKSVVLAGDRNIVRLTFGDSGIVLPLRPPPRPPAAPPPHPRPGEPPRELDLLDPERSTLPFIGRADMLARLHTWIAADADLSVYALTALLARPRRLRPPRPPRPQTLTPHPTAKTIRRSNPRSRL